MGRRRMEKFDARIGVLLESGSRYSQRMMKLGWNHEETASLPKRESRKGCVNAGYEEGSLFRFVNMSHARDVDVRTEW